jgi:NOL1/NOP2/fmu family ribosome biogenesis protein
MLNRPALADVVEVIDRAPYWDQLATRFGIPPATFDGFMLVQPQSKKLHLVPEDHRPPVRPTPETVGLPFLRIQMAVPKLTTAATMQFGQHATRNVIDATDEQAVAYLARDTFVPSSNQLERCTTRGHVIVRHDGWGVGIGFLEDDPEHGPAVRSMFPKGWARSVVL